MVIHSKLSSSSQVRSVMPSSWSYRFFSVFDSGLPTGQNHRQDAPASSPKIDNPVPGNPVGTSRPITIDQNFSFLQAMQANPANYPRLSSQVVGSLWWWWFERGSSVVGDGAKYPWVLFRRDEGKGKGAGNRDAHVPLSGLSAQTCNGSVLIMPNQRATQARKCVIHLVDLQLLGRFRSLGNCPPPAPGEVLRM